MTNLDKNIKRKYSFSEYKPDWINQFNSIQDFLKSVFKEKAINIEHVGSTSIPGMKAKPIIDGLVIVKDVEDLKNETKEMIEAGYEYGENYIGPDTVIFFKTGPDGEKTQNIHVCENGHSKQRQFLVMRNFFRTFPEKAKEYSELKESNSKKGNYIERYPNLKNHC